MPNWCNNSIEIKGPKDKIKQLWEGATAEGDDGGLLNAMVPMPKELNDTTSPTPEGSKQPVVNGCDNWYDWRVRHWGCKWDVNTEGLEYEEDGDEATIHGWFDSPWGPPLTALETYSEANEDVYIDEWYEEGGMDFAGNWNSEEGVDDYIEGISDYARKVIKTGESGSSLYDRLDEYFEITEQRREWIEEEELEDESTAG